MADNGDNFGECIRAGAHEQHPNFAYGFRGPDCQFVREVARCLQDGSARAATDFLATLDVLEKWFKANSKHEVFLGDSTIPLRSAGLCAVVRARLEKYETNAGGHIREAKTCFDAAWAESAKLFRSDWQPAAATSADAAKEADRGLFARYQNQLAPWTYGSWMVWDVLCQMNQSAPSFVERTPVLFGDGDGYVMYLVAEVVPGPAGLVTPNWWKLGLTAFPNEDKDADRYFFGAVERAMTLAMPQHQGYRVRWHLESSDVEPWRMGLKGRSGEAAAAAAVLGAFEQVAERDARDAAGPNPVLDCGAAVTAIVGDPRGKRFSDTPIEPVTGGDRLSAKLAVAASHGIDLVVISKQQTMDEVVPPPALRLTHVETIGAALDELRGVNRAFDAINADIRRRFEAEWTEEPTPASR